ncbi:MAG: TadE/TadG family type IV pilus assembly protein, partial [Pseudomonadota bacterium]
MAHTFSRRVSDVRQRYRSDERGVVALMMAMAFVFVVSIVGGAIDYSRWLTASSKMQSTLDASVLAAARTFMVASETEAKATAQTYFEQNKHQHTSNASASFVIENGSTVRGTITGGIQTSFLRVIGIDELPLNLTTGVSMSGAADGKGGNLEMAVMLDITGSMCDDGSGPCASSTKLNALQEATRDLANIVIWEDQSVYTSKMALIPFSTRVRLAPNGDGGSIMQAMTELAPTWSGYVSRCVDWTITPGTSSETGGSFNCHSYATQYANNWKVRPCVTDRNGSHEHAETSPSLNAWMNAHGGNRSPIAHGSASTPQSTQLGVIETDPYVAWNYNEGGSCSDVAESNQLLPLTANKSVVIDRINGLTAVKP